MNYLKRFFTDSLIRPIIFFIAFLFIITVSVNTFLIVSTAKLNSKLDAVIPWFVSVENVYFLPPNGLILKNVVLAETSSMPPAVHIETAVIRFALLMTILKRQVSVSQVDLSRPLVDALSFQAFWTQHGQDILDYLNYLPQNDFRLRIQNILWRHRQSVSDARLGVLSHFDLRIRKGTMRVKAGIKKHTEFVGRLENFWKKIWLIGQRSKDLMLALDLEGRVEGQLFMIKSLTLRREHFFSRLWGDMDNQVLRLYGFALARTDPADPLQKDLKRKIPRIDLAFLRSREGVTFDPDVFLLDLDMQAHLTYPEICVQQADFTLNNTPTYLQGCVSLEQPYASDFILTLKSPIECPGPPQDSSGVGAEVVFRYRGQSRPGGYANHADVDFKFLDSGGAGFRVDHVSVALHDFVLRQDAGRNIEFSVPLTEIRFSAFDQPKQVDLENIKAAFIFRTDRYKVVQLEAPFYDGSLFGRAWIDKSAQPWSFTSVLVLKDLQAHFLEAFLPYFTKVQGRLSSRIALKNQPGWGLKGKLWIAQGRLNDLEFFKWLAETFTFPSLRNVDFEELSLNFFVTPRGYGVDEIHLESPDVALNGHFHVGSDRFVDSTISLSLGRKVLKESPRFVRLLRMFKKDVPSLVFDFRLSGALEAMNFQWMQSAFKQRIRQRIPDFIERKIERGIDAILEPVGPDGLTDEVPRE